MTELRILTTGPLTTVQDLGRTGAAHIGVGVSGAADRGSFRLANRLVGNPEGYAGLEVTLGGLSLRAEHPLTVALTGADCPLAVDGYAAAPNTVLRVPAGGVLTVGTPSHGARGYLAVRGGVEVDPVLGSRATDTLSGLGPPPVSAGDVLPVGPAPAEFPLVDTAPVPAPPEGDLVLTVTPGPRADWFTGEALATLLGTGYRVTPESDRVGMRLDGPPLERRHGGELPSEGMVAGALQVPPSGRPTLFLADHPVTGGYPVIAVLRSTEVDRAAQARPGQRLWFRTRRGHGPFS
ncbi:biotin-dependent carboxyltransferase family protein [Actinopolyspora mortivallis]|uniref:5-oxoprolinase subunit C family protein n=1 Tax=Actinopolyspora mortivallis TaxID=33906 RepID=UPI000381A47C|nr:biotin-dependent carboxyltransferase family protein [Actinopolyspora mortivallis]